MTCRTVRALSLALLVAALAGSLCVRNAWAQAAAEPDASASEQLRTDTQRIARLFYGEQHEAVVRAAGPLLARYGVTPASLPIALFEAESQLRLGNRDEAARCYERTLPVIASLNNVQQRGFAFVFFRLALLARAKRQLDQAVAKTEEGLRLEPQNTWGQILLGEFFNERGDRARAVSHFKDVAAASFPTNEERAVLAIKIDRLTTGKVGTSVRPPDVGGARVHEGLSIGLVPLPDLPKDVVLTDVCIALEVAWRIHCEVLPPIAIPDADVFVIDRGQYDAERLVNELGRRAAANLRPGRYLMAVAGRDLFGPKTNYVFSWQTLGGEAGIGVISAYRFAAALDEFYEKGAVLMRRVTIQAISTSGSMLGFTRPTNPECPTAFPIDFREFQQKGARLCGSDEQQRDELLRTRGGAAKAFSDAQRREIDRVYRAYYLQ